MLVLKCSNSKHNLFSHLSNCLFRLRQTNKNRLTPGRDEKGCKMDVDGRLHRRPSMALFMFKTALFMTYCKKKCSQGNFEIKIFFFKILAFWGFFQNSKIRLFYLVKVDRWQFENCTYQLVDGRQPFSSPPNTHPKRHSSKKRRVKWKTLQILLSRAVFNVPLMGRGI